MNPADPHPLIVPKGTGRADRNLSGDHPDG